ncbi:MAG: helix-turn-helix transcriptional regulator [Phycicoccus sp.]
MPVDSSPTSRALRTLEILRLRPGTGARDLADRLGVTERAARRYVSILREAGIVVESTRGPYGGYRLGRGTPLAPVAFTEEEALGLVMAVLDARPSAGRDEEPIGVALGKVIGVLPERIGRQAAALREHAAAAPDPLRAPDPGHASALVDAIAARRRVVLDYRSQAGVEQRVEVEPWALVIRYGRWYLLCRSLHADSVRTYRVDRVLAVERTAHSFTPPEDLDPVATLEEHLGLGWEYRTRVVFDAPVEQVVRWIRPSMGRLTSLGSGCVLDGSTGNPSMYAQEWLSTVPFPFRVESGPELRAAVAEVAARFATAVQPP